MLRGKGGGSKEKVKNEVPLHVERSSSYRIGICCTASSYSPVYQAYKAWLEVLEKGIGETLLDSGFFDATLTSDDDYDEEGNNLYDTYTDYQTNRAAPGTKGYDYRGRDDERGFDYNEG